MSKRHGKMAPKSEESSGYPYLSKVYEESLAKVDIPQETHLAGRFTIKRQLGRGGWGTVYLAQDSLYACEVALKVSAIGSSLQGPAEVPAKEIHLSRQLDDFTHVIRTYDPHIVEWQGLRLLLHVMEFGDGGTFRHWLAQHKKNTEIRRNKGLEFFLQACRGVESIHRAGLLHLDLKPENLLFVNERLKVSDLGSAYAPSFMGEDGDSPVSPDIQEMGTPLYMSPEQSVSPHPETLDRRSDIYSMGVVLYELLSSKCRPPFWGSDSVIRECHRSVAPLPLEGVPHWLAESVTRCLAKNKSDRYQSMEELIKALSGNTTLSRNKRQSPDEETELSREEKREAASSYFSKGFFTQANVLFDEMIAENHDDQWALHMKQEIERKYRQAEQCYREAESEMEKGNLHQAIELVQAAADIYADHPVGKLVQMKAALMAKTYADCLEEGQKALRVGQWGIAIVCFEKVIPLNGMASPVYPILERLRRIQGGRQEMYSALGRGDLERANELAGLVDALVEELFRFIPDQEVGNG